MEMFLLSKLYFSQKLSVNSSVEPPDAIDWRDFGAVTEVKDQGPDCGSCYAFASIGALESQHFIKTGNLLNLSEQEIVDCSTGNTACSGGVSSFTYTYLIENGIGSSDDYPYKAKQGSCEKKNVPRSPAKVFGYGSFYDGSGENEEETLKQIIAQFGPVETSIDASPISFNFYKEGVYNDRECSNLKFNHAVLVVGYGRDENLDMDYWIVKNSWSEDWGENGYIRIARNNNKTCGIGTLGGEIALLDESAEANNEFRSVRLLVVSVISAISLIIMCFFSCCFCCYKIFGSNRNQYSI